MNFNWHKSTRKKSSLRLITLMGLLILFWTANLVAQRIEVEGSRFRVDGKEIFINGLNTPWDNWNDFGGEYDHDFWDAEFQRIIQSRGNAARIWITCNGDVGIEISESGFVTGATPAHWENLKDLFHLAQKHQIYIMATLISFDHTFDKYIKYERWRKMLTNNQNIGSYIDNYVVPFVRRFGDNPYLWSIDVCNEIEWMHENSEKGKLPWNCLQYFVARVAVAVHENSNVLVTLGSAAVKWNSDSPGCEGNFWSDQKLQAQYNSPKAYLDFYSPHYYGWVVRWFGNFAGEKSPKDYGIDDRPCVIGENPAMGIYLQKKSGFNELIVPIEEAYIKTYQNGWSGLMIWTSNGVDKLGSLKDSRAGLEAFYQLYPKLVFPLGSNTDSNR